MSSPSLINLFLFLLRPYLFLIPLSIFRLLLFRYCQYHRLLHVTVYSLSTFSPSITHLLFFFLHPPFRLFIHLSSLSPPSSSALYTIDRSVCLFFVSLSTSSLSSSQLSSVFHLFFILSIYDHPCFVFLSHISFSLISICTYCIAWSFFTYPYPPIPLSFSFPSYPVLNLRASFLLFPILPHRNSVLSMSLLVVHVHNLLTYLFCFFYHHSYHRPFVRSWFAILLPSFSFSALIFHLHFHLQFLSV